MTLPPLGAVRRAIKASEGRDYVQSPLVELSHADYLQRAGGTAAPLSEEHWERAIEQLQSGYGVTDVAHVLDVNAGQVALVDIQLKDVDPESIAAAPSTRTTSPSVDDAGVTTPRGTFVSAAELDRVRGLQAQNSATRNDDGTPTEFGAAIGKHGTSVRDKNSGLNHVGRALGQQMIENKEPQGKLATTLDISSNTAADLRREVKARAVASSEPRLAPTGPGVTTPRGTFVPAAELDRDAHRVRRSHRQARHKHE